MAFAILIPATLVAQDQRAAQAAFPQWELGPYVGFSWGYPAGPGLGLIRDRRHAVVGVQLTANFLRSGSWALGYSPEVVPLLVVSNNPTFETIVAPNGWRFTIEGRKRGPVAGVGISPLGLQGQVRIAARWRLYVGAAAGVVWFTRQVPVADSRAFNYTFEVAGGLRWQVRQRDALRIGYKFHHLSNAYSAPANPGLDAAVFQIGYERSWR